jgi:hypothetical protein
VTAAVYIALGWRKFEQDDADDDQSDTTEA